MPGGRFQAPVTPSLAELNTQALDGDQDACLLLARRSASCKTFTEFLDRYVPEPEIRKVFDLFADSWYRAVQERAMEGVPTLELPSVPSNLNQGWEEAA